ALCGRAGRSRGAPVRAGPCARPAGSGQPGARRGPVRADRPVGWRGRALAVRPRGDGPARGPPREAAMIPRRTARLVLAGIILLYLGIGALYALNTPPWQSPDEPAHYNYIAQIAGEGCCPVIAPGDWDAAYLSELTTEQFPEEADLSPLEYEDHQPPLYYLLLSVVYGLTGGSLLALRLATLVLGAGVVLLTYATIARLFPVRLTLALGAAAFVAFIPQHLSVLASVNNDALA